MIWIVLGVLLWSVSHLLKRMTPGLRESMGNAGMGVVAVASLAGIVLMVVGYRSADATPLWSLGPAAVHINNALMVVSVVLFGLGRSKSTLRAKLRHPMLTGVIVWAVAHLLVNGDTPSLVLFGGLGLWAIISMIMINRAEPAPEPFAEGTAQGTIRLFVISAVVFAIIASIHTWIGPWPFPG